MPDNQDSTSASSTVGNFFSLFSEHPYVSSILLCFVGFLIYKLVSNIDILKFDKTDGLSVTNKDDRISFQGNKSGRDMTTTFSRRRKVKEFSNNDATGDMTTKFN